MGRRTNNAASGGGKKRRDNKNKPIIIVVIAAIVVALVYFAYKSLTDKKHYISQESEYTVANVNADGTLVMNNDLTVEILGIKADQKTVDFLQKNVVGKRVKLICNSSDTKPYYVDARKDKVRAYVTVLENGVEWSALDGYLLREGLADLNDQYCSDSLKAFRGYVNPVDLDNSKKSRKLLDETGLFKKMTPATFLIMSAADEGINFGTGFFINDRGWALTCNHVLPPNPDACVVCLSDEKGNITRERNYRVKRYITEWRSSFANGDDWVLIVVDLDNGQKSPYLELADTIPEVGTHAAVLGNPLGELATFSAGIISQVRPDEGLIQTDASATFGNSGGPIVNYYGEVLGILQSVKSINGQQSAGNLTYAVDIQRVKKELKKLNVDYK